MADQTLKTPPPHTRFIEKFERRMGHTGPAFTPKPVTETPATHQGAAPTTEQPAADANNPQNAVPPVESKTPESAPAPQNAAPIPAPPVEAENEETTFLKLYAKMTGKKIDSLDELKEKPKPLSKEEQEAADAAEKAEALEWGLGTGKITKEAYDKAIVARSKDKRAIALELYMQERREENPRLSNEEGEEDFREFYGENDEEGSPRQKMGLKQMNKIADAHLAQFNDIDSLPEGYKSYKAGEEKYKAHVKSWKSVAKELPKELDITVPYTTVEGTTMNLTTKVPVDQKVVDRILQEYTGRGSENIFSDKDNTPENIAQVLNYHLESRVLKQALPAIFADLVQQAETDVMARVKNARQPGQSFGAPPLDAPVVKTPPKHTSLAEKQDRRFRKTN